MPTAWWPATFSETPSVQLFNEQLSSLGLIVANLRMATLPSEEVADVYDVIGTDAEIAPGRAAVLFAIEAKFKK